MPLVIAFVSQKGGVGKSALARSVAVALSRAKLKVLLGDCDAQQQTTLKWSEVRAQNEKTPVIAVSSAESSRELLAQGASYDVVILDMPGRADRETLEAAKASHLIVHPTGPTLDDLYPSVLLFHELAGEGIPTSRMLYVVCRALAKPEVEAAVKYLRKAVYEVADAALFETLHYRMALNSGGALIETEDQVANDRAAAVVELILEKANRQLETVEAAAKKTGRSA